MISAKFFIKQSHNSWLESVCYTDRLTVYETFAQLMNSRMVKGEVKKVVRETNYASGGCKYTFYLKNDGFHDAKWVVDIDLH